jgi:hypothetical protein
MSLAVYEHETRAAALEAGGDQADAAREWLASQTLRAKLERKETHITGPEFSPD